MAIKSANVLARVEPEVKEMAETILAQLGIPASVVINMLYKQIVMTKSIPFSIALPTEPIAREILSAKEFDTMMKKGMEEAKEDKSRLAVDVFTELRRELN